MVTRTVGVVLAALISGCGGGGESNPLTGECSVNDNVERTKTNSIYTDHGDGTVTDAQTGLMWAQCSMGQTFVAGQALDSTCNNAGSTYRWAKAMEAAQTANSEDYLGYDDWRVPNVTELASLVDTACEDTTINTDLFPDTMRRAYMSSSPDPRHRKGVWRVFFEKGGVGGGPNTKRSDSFLRLVRGGN